MKKIILSGGFHNSGSIKLKVDSDFNSSCNLYNYLSENQVKRLERHFCGIRGCQCSSWQRATIQNE